MRLSYIQNDEQECFRWCLKYHQSAKDKNASRICVFKKVKDKYNYKGIDFSLGMTINSPRPARRDHCTEWDSPPARGAAGRLVLADGTTSAGP